MDAILNNLQNIVKISLEALRMRMDKCKLVPYLCASRKCEGFCARDILLWKYDELRQKCEERGIFLFGVEYATRMLNEDQLEIKDFYGEKIFSGHLDFYVEKVKIPNNGAEDQQPSDLWASSLADCPARTILKRVLPKPKSLEETLNFGRLAHQVFNGEFGDNYVHLYEFVEHPLPRSEYCELGVRYKLDGIEIGGRIDALLYADFEGRKIPVVLDYKTSRWRETETLSCLVQLGTYKLAIKAKEALLITLKYHNGLPKPTITYVDEKLDEWLKDYLLNKFRQLSGVLCGNIPRGDECENCYFRDACRKYNFKRLRSSWPWNKFLNFS